jgi:magnesium transporter
MARVVVLVRARDRPGLLSDVAARLRDLGANIILNLGYAVEGEAVLLFIVDIPMEAEDLEDKLWEKLSDLEDVDISVAKLGAGAGELLAEFLEERPGLVQALEDHLAPADILDAVLRLPEEKRRQIYRFLKLETLAHFLREADENILEEILESIPLSRLAEAISRLEPDEAVDVLQKLPEDKKKQILVMLPDELRKEAVKLLQYPPESAGGIMTTSIPVLRARDTVQDALQTLRQGHYDVRDIIVVVDDEGRLVGIIPVDELLRAKPTEPLAKLARRPRITIEPEADREEAARLMLRYDVNRLPVVDRFGRFLGAITVEDVADVLAEEAAEDLALLGGLEKPRERYLAASVKDLFKIRLPWLLLIYVIESVTASVIKSYEDLISRVAVIAAFIPLIMDTGGNVGSQATSMIIRALALGELSERSIHDVIYVFLKELATAATIGAVFGSIGFGFAYVLGGSARVAFAVALTLFIVIVFADIVGAILPIVARRLGIDPATLSAPLITTIVDVSVVFIYLTLAAKLVLGT